MWISGSGAFAASVGRRGSPPGVEGALLTANPASVRCPSRPRGRRRRRDARGLRRRGHPPPWGWRGRLWRAERTSPCSRRGRGTRPSTWGRNPPPAQRVARRRTAGAAAVWRRTRRLVPARLTVRRPTPCGDSARPYRQQVGDRVQTRVRRRCGRPGDSDPSPPQPSHRAATAGAGAEEPARAALFHAGAHARLARAHVLRGIGARHVCAQPLRWRASYSLRARILFLYIQGIFSKLM